MVMVIQMKKLTLSAVFLFLASGLLFAEARIEFVKTLHDFGKVEQRSIVKHVFEFRNTGTEPLVISKLEAG